MLRLGLVVIVTLALAALTPLAHAAPPDQTWIHGLYDNADYDDVVLLATSASSIIGDSPRPAHERLGLLAADLAPSYRSPGITDPGLRLRVPRGPPIA